MKKHIVSHIAIYILSAVMLFFGYYHLAHPKAMMEYGYIPRDSSVIWVQIVGVAFILAAISFIINNFLKIAAYLLALMLL
jgi:hypothetical protein